MKEEISSAVEFLTNILRTRNISQVQSEQFTSALVNLLCNRYQNHWFPEKPFKGSGFRCIRLNHNMDPLIVQAGKMCGLEVAFLKSTFPPELTMWVDPQEVSYRIGENGSVGHIFSNNTAEDSDQYSPRSSPMSSPRSSPQPPSPPTYHNVHHYNYEMNSTNRNFMTCKEQFMNVMPSMSRDAVNYQKFPAYVFS